MPFEPSEDRAAGSAAGQGRHDTLSCCPLAADGKTSTRTKRGLQHAAVVIRLELGSQQQTTAGTASGGGRRERKTFGFSDFEVTQRRVFSLSWTLVARPVGLLFLPQLLPRSHVRCQGALRLQITQVALHMLVAFSRSSSGFLTRW